MFNEEVSRQEELDDFHNKVSQDKADQRCGTAVQQPSPGRHEEGGGASVAGGVGAGVVVVSGGMEGGDGVGGGGEGVWAEVGGLASVLGRDKDHASGEQKGGKVVGSLECSGFGSALRVIAMDMRILPQVQPGSFGTINVSVPTFGKNHGWVRIWDFADLVRVAVGSSCVNSAEVRKPIQPLWR